MRGAFGMVREMLAQDPAYRPTRFVLKVWDCGVA
jgi:hypothetical protein